MAIETVLRNYSRFSSKPFTDLYFMSVFFNDRTKYLIVPQSFEYSTPNKRLRDLFNKINEISLKDPTLSYFVKDCWSRESLDILWDERTNFTVKESYAVEFLSEFMSTGIHALTLNLSLSYPPHKGLRGELRVIINSERAPEIKREIENLFYHHYKC